jgi:ethanolamine utilization protein EutA
MRLSKDRRATLLNVDIGGGTTKLALIRNGELLATVAIAAGGRLLVEEAGKGLVRIETPAVEVAKDLGIALAPGGRLAPEDRHRIVERMAALLVAMIGRHVPDALASRLLVTDPWPADTAEIALDAITFSGGVAEYLYGREKARFGDLGADLAHDLRHAIADGALAAPVWDPGHGIRATVTGAAQFSVQISGNTVFISDAAVLPLRNLPVLFCRFDLGGERVASAALAAEIRAALTRADRGDGDGAIAIAFRWQGDPAHARLAAVAEGIAAALSQTIAAGHPLVLVVDRDVGLTLGRVLNRETAPGARVISLDGIELKELDYVDIGAIIEVTQVVPVIIKSLLF